MDPSPAPLYFEEKICRRLGFTRRVFKSIRDEVLKKNEGWKMHGREVVLNQDGLDAILVHLRASSNSVPTDFREDRVPMPEKKEAGTSEVSLTSPAGLITYSEDDAGSETPPAAAADPSTSPSPPVEPPACAGPEELTVRRTYPNERILQAVTGGGDLVMVHVKSNLNFLPQMTLKARLTRPGHYQLEGRCPRSRGRY